MRVARGPDAQQRDEARRQRSLRALRTFAGWLDTRFVVPGTRWRIGVDGLVGLIPGVGDAAGGLLSLAVVLWARRLGAPPRLLLRMLGNVAVDVAVGAIPLVGDLFDIRFKVNCRNVDLMLRFLENRDSAPR